MAAQGQVSRLFDDFARALGLPRSGRPRLWSCVFGEPARGDELVTL
jgi:hypothetical protein